MLLQLIGNVCKIPWGPLGFNLIWSCAKLLFLNVLELYGNTRNALPVRIDLLSWEDMHAIAAGVSTGALTHAHLDGTVRSRDCISRGIPSTAVCLK